MGEEAEAGPLEVEVAAHPKTALGLPPDDPPGSPSPRASPSPYATTPGWSQTAPTRLQVDRPTVYLCCN